MSGGQLGGGPSGGKGYFPAAFEEAKARAQERRLDLQQHGGTKSLDARSRGMGVLLLVAVAVGLMSYAVWASLGPVAGVAAAVLLVLGALALWRFWR